MRKITKYLLSLGIFYIVMLNIKMFSHPKIIYTQKTIYNKEVYQQLSFLKDKLHRGAGEKMQEIYPEGFIFIHSLYGLSWANLVSNLPDDIPIKQEALNEIKWTLHQMESKQGKAAFQKELYLPYGVFYQGWLNYTRAKYLSLTEDYEQQKKFQISCQQIEQAVNHHYTPFLYSYSSGCWPADNIIALAALTIHDQLFAPKYTNLRKNWLNAMQTKIDKNGLIPHSVNLGQGDAIEQSRGSSQSLMLCFLIEIDSTIARNQYQKFKALFVDERFGLPGIREYPKGISGYADIDAGPVILDIGGAASLVGMGTVGQYEDMKLYNGLRNSISGFGMAFNTFGKRRYLFGKTPMADTFIAWSHSRVPLNNLKERHSFNYWKFRLFSLIIILFFSIFIKRL